MQIDDLTFALLLGEQEEMWPDGHNPIVQINIFNKYTYCLTAVEIILQDKMGLIGTKFAFEDGMKIILNTGKELTIEQWKLRVAKLERMGPQLYRVTALEDRSRYFQNANTGFYEDTSSAAIQKLAKENGLESDVDTTSDKQVWLGNGDKNFVFARRMALRGYAGASSLMWLAYYKGKLLYKDLNAINYDRPKARFSVSELGNSGGVPNHLLQRIESVSNSGLLNSIAGYGAQMVEQTIIDNKEPVFKEVQVKKRTNSVQVNEKVKAEVTTPPSTQGQLRSDNTNQNYNSGVYQNLRGMAMMSERSFAIVGEQTGIGIFDPVEVEAGALNMASSEPNNTYNGKWLVVSRIIQITGNVYQEVFELLREGIQK